MLCAKHTSGFSGLRVRAAFTTFGSEAQPVSSDDYLLQRIREGDARACSEFVHRHKARAMTLAVRMLRSREDAEEALQDAFLKVLKTAHTFERRSNATTWLYRIVYNTCANVIEKRSALKAAVYYDTDELNEEFHSSGAEYHPEAIYDDSEFAAAVYRAIEHLPPEYSVILTLFYVQQLRYEEIADVTGLPLGTVKTKLFRGRTMLKTMLEKLYGTEYAGGKYAEP